MMHKIDALGRVVIPKHLRERHRLTPHSEVLFSEMKEGVLLCRAEECCLLCGGTTGLVPSGGKALCKACLSEFCKASKEENR